jgi:hypothetical protein
MSLRPAPKEPKNPALRQHAKERRAKAENRFERGQILADDPRDLVKARDAQIETMLSSTEESLRHSRSTLFHDASLKGH